MTDALPDFTRTPEDSPYAALHKLLWANEPTPIQPGDSAEPEALRKCIEGWAAGDLSLWRDSQGDVAMDVDEDGSEPPPPPPEVRYINLRKHPTLCVHVLCDTSTFVVRQEYVEFMAHAMQCEIKKRCFFLTGKSMGACYFLCLLLASGQSVFFIPNRSRVYYFSAAGVQDAAHGPTANMDRSAIAAAVGRSWVLIDIDLPPSATWFPELWIIPCAGLVWTSSPQAHRRKHFTKQFKASTWYMKPWSSQEIEAVTYVLTLDDMNREDIRDRFNKSGPVARDLFGAPDMTMTASIDTAINMALADNLFNFATSEPVDQVDKASHRMFLTQPLEGLDEAGRPFLERRQCSVDFLSNYIASRTVELMEQHVEKVRRQSHTCSAAGKLVESMLHRALMYKKIDLPAAFGGGPVTDELELIGKAEDFVLETHTPHQRDSRPLYLRPQSPNFAAVDAIIVTQGVLCLVQSSLAKSHSSVVKTLLGILARLATNKIAVDSLHLVYCPISTDEVRVTKLVRQASEKLAALQAQPDVRDLGKLSQIARKRLMRLQVVGYIFDTQEGLVELSWWNLACTLA